MRGAWSCKRGEASLLSDQTDENQDDHHCQARIADQPHVVWAHELFYQLGLDGWIDVFWHVKVVFDEAIEQKWIEQWLFYANSVRYASAMAGPDYASFKNGWWKMTHNLQIMKDHLEFKSTKWIVNSEISNLLYSQAVIPRMYYGEWPSLWSWKMPGNKVQNRCSS